ncbi:hypothetical protein AN477_02785 [Alicyclobacillus ferrooxydans]|uniref:homocysteine desulfhydrase n=1 Tax=Alicyclobacillus ferrooxydans TaxID=471514 RepID=A0A0P9D071_9BACL|nr:hypothetical protein AN477_02785 [Alicyclobacillus ferrooxydans]
MHHQEPARHTSAAIRPETTPLYMSSVYTFPNLDEVRAYYSDPASAYVYRRNGNPNTAQVEKIISRLEATEDSVLTSSGMAAISAGCFALLHPGDALIATEVLYGGTYAFFEQVLRPWGVEVTYADVNDPASLEAAYGPTTRMIYAETVANPLLQVTDLETVSGFAKAHDCLLMVDNTFATPSLTKPYSYGTDLVVNSLTKYLNGHSDVIGGSVSGSQQVIAKVRKFVETFGGVLSPFDAWMTERGLETFHIRVRQQCENAMQLARALQNHQAVHKVYYPGLDAHETHEVAKRILQGGFGAMVSFDLAGGEPAANAFVASCQHVDFAPSLGGVRTTLSHPALTSHRAFTSEERLRLGITDGVIRMSVGIEPFSEIWEDISQALSRASL